MVWLKPVDVVRGSIGDGPVVVRPRPLPRPTNNKLATLNNDFYRLLFTRLDPQPPSLIDS